MTSPTPAPALSPARRRLFLALLLALPWLLLLLLELGLRLGGYGGAYPLFVAHPPRPELLVANPDVARRWFPGGAFTPTPEIDFFRARKAPNGYRIFFQGESSAQGFPYGHGAAPSRMLEQRLGATFPDRDIEVVNAAFTAVSSYTLLDQVDEIIAQRPDAVLIYTGHNEYYGAFGVGARGSLGRWRPAVRAYLALQRLRTVQLLGDALGRLTTGAGRGAPGRDAPRTVMQLMAEEQHIPLGSPLFERGVAQFRANLRALLARYREAGIPVLIGTLASNERDQPPFVGEDAAAAYARARAHGARGEDSLARAAYREAKERDGLRFRAPEALNRVVREEAAGQGAVVVETQEALERASPGGIVGNTLMLEHLHPNLDGYFIIADAFYEAMRARGMIGSWSGAVPAERARRELAVTPLDSLVGLLRTDRLVSGWPFRRRGSEKTPIVDTLTPRNPLEQLARAAVLGDLPWPEATERLRAAAERAGDHELALRASLAMAQEYSWSPEPLMDAARISILRRRYDDALRHARGAVRRRETAPSVQLVGLLLLRQGEHAAAMPHLRRAAELAPSDRRMIVPLRAAEALPALEARRHGAPRDTIVLFELASAYALTQQFERAREALAALRRVAPAHAGAQTLSARLPDDSP